MCVTETLNLVAVRHRKGKSKNVMPQNSISLVYRTLEVVAGLIFDNIWRTAKENIVHVSSLCPASFKSVWWIKEKILSFINPHLW